jgi:RHS repeat-associated protein
LTHGEHKEKEAGESVMLCCLNTTRKWPKPEPASTLPSGTPTYDANGNLLTDHFELDNSSWAFDALGRPVEKTWTFTPTQAVYDPLGRNLALMNGQSFQDGRVPLVGGTVARYFTGTTGPVSYWHPDWLGTSRLESTPSRTVAVDAAFAPFGEQYVYTSAFDSIFTGSAYHDAATDLWDFPAREYHPTQGRWISPDPAGPAGVTLTDPQTWNAYAYVRNTPTSYVDPDGLVSYCPYGTDNTGHQCLPPPPQPLPPDICALYGLCQTWGPGGTPGGGGAPSTPANNGTQQPQADACAAPILSAVNTQFGTSLTADNNVQLVFNNGQATNLNILGSGLPAAQFNSIQTGRYPLGSLTWLTGYGPTLHITGRTFFDPAPAMFINSNVGGATSVQFTAHIDSSFAYNPIGALIHLIRDVLHIGGPRKPC